MPITVKIKGNQDTEEHKDALALKEIFIRDIPRDVNGEILIISNATLFGQETKDVDLIVLGNFEKFNLYLNSKSTNSKHEEGELKNRNIFFNNFCFVIETKHHRAQDVVLDGLTLCVKYNNRLADVTTQSEKQKYSLMNYFKDRINTSPYICNFIWLRNVNQNSLRSLISEGEYIRVNHNYLPSDLNIKWLFQLACLQNFPFTPIDRNTDKEKGYSTFNSLKKYNDKYDIDEMYSIFQLFEKVKNGTGDLTRKKIEYITRDLLNTQQYAQAIGEKLVIVNGRAGTGKTIKLLTIACNLALNSGERCLILTYNNALVSDIKRTLALAEVPNQIDKYSINIITLHKFFYELILGFGLVEGKYIPEYLSNYYNYIVELTKHIESGLIDDRDIQALMKNRHDEVAWDYVLIDESQDWDIRERDLIFKIFTYKRVLITDGIDQLVRNQAHCNWTKGLRPNIDFHLKPPERKSLRQKVNLIKFVNSFANEIGINWNIEPKEELIGGKVIISVKPYNKDLHQKEFSYCKESGNSPYEMMFLVPPSLVDRIKTNDGKGISRKFKEGENFKQMGIPFWDGTNTDLRTQYVVNLEEHRVLQYDSCRGLEGWTVVCLDLDEFVRYKKDTYEGTIVEGELALETEEEKMKKFVYLWALIPLTRAIDTLIITVKSKDSEIGRKLYNIYSKHPDFVDWIE